MATAPTVRASSVGASTGTSTTASHTIPAVVQVGDFMVASIRTAANTGTIATPTNWTLIQGPSRSTSALSLATFWKVAEAGDTGGAATVSSAQTPSVAWVVQFVALAGGFKPDTSTAFIDNTSNTAVQWTGMNTAYDNERVLWITAGATSANTYTPPTSYVEERDANGITLATLTYATPSATGNVDGATSAAHRTITHALAVRPVPDPVATGLVDAFTGTTISTTRWAVTAEAPATLTQNDVLIHTLSATGAFAAYASSKQPYSLDESSFVVEWPQVPTANANILQTSELAMTTDGGNMLYWEYTNGNIRVIKYVGGTPSTLYSAAYSGTDHRWLRIRETGGTVYWDTSTDGLSWTNRHSEAAPFAVTDFRVHLYAGTTATVASPGVGHQDNLNNPPAHSGYYRSRNRVA